MPRHPRVHAEGLLYHVMARGNDATLFRKGRLASVVEARDRFSREAVLAQGYLASQVADFLAYHPSNISRALQKN